MDKAQDKSGVLEAMEEVKNRYRMIKRYGILEWKVHEMANCHKGTWRAIIMLKPVLTNKDIASWAICL